MYMRSNPPHRGVLAQLAQWREGVVVSLPHSLDHPLGVGTQDVILQTLRLLLLLLLLVPVVPNRWEKPNQNQIRQKTCSNQIRPADVARIKIMIWSSRAQQTCLFICLHTLMFLLLTTLRILFQSDLIRLYDSLFLWSYFRGKCFYFWGSGLFCKLMLSIIKSDNFPLWDLMFLLIGSDLLLFGGLIPSIYWGGGGDRLLFQVL